MMPETIAELDPSKLLFFSEAGEQAVDASQQGDDPTTFPRTFKRTQMAMVGKPPPITTGAMMQVHLDD